MEISVIFKRESTRSSSEQIDVSFYMSGPLIDYKLRHNIVKVAGEPRAAGEWFRSKLWKCYDEIYLQ